MIDILPILFVFSVPFCLEDVMILSQMMDYEHAERHCFSSEKPSQYSDPPSLCMFLYFYGYGG